MLDEDFQRARRPEQKEERRTLLLEAARNLLLESRSEQDLSLNELAKHAGMAKSNVYRYFESREAILVELLRQEWTEWFAVLQRTLSESPLPTPGRPSGGRARRRDLTRVDALVRRMAETMSRRPLLGRLCSILASVIEQNVSPETVRGFKLESLGFVQMLAEFLHGQAPELSVHHYEELFHTGFAALVGLWSFSHPAPAVAEVLSDPRLAPFRHDFARDYGRHLSLLARGLLADEP
jgi:AcrR family transcriptional regulator